MQALPSPAAALPRHHLVIAGTGRAGTTFLVELLTDLGLDTGYAPDEVAWHKNALAHAGLEHDIRKPGCPYVVKNPAFADYAPEVFARSDLRVDRLIVPVRQLVDAAQSRRRMQAINQARMSRWRRLKHWLRPRLIAGGLVYTRSSEPGAQEAMLAQKFFDLVLAATVAEVPITFLHFPRLVQDAHYLYGALRPVLRGIDYAAFVPVYERVANPRLVHAFETERGTARCPAG
ncbi:hypothetical protein [Inhella sp.]|uniref:hypothetical protein n=1 Tax=Inhella sp. TaxID=1921806 RepID=UPI0035ADB52F